MKPIFTALCLAVIHSTTIPSPLQLRAEHASEAALAVVEQLPASVSADHRLSYAKLLFVWSGYESSWYASPPGDNDKGAACGIMQIHTPEKWVPGATCEKVRASAHLGYVVGLTVIRQLEAKCGSLVAGLTAYSTDGACHNYVLPLVRKRCKLAGLTEGCVL